jgi:hypothetical protein
MKHLFNVFILLLAGFLAISGNSATAQRVLIGSGIADASAIMEVRGPSGGVLIPRMTSAQRQAIASPVAGLMVYETTSNRIYKYNGTGWTYMLDDLMWTMVNNKVVNLTDSIGINIGFPAEKLSVGGNVRVTNGDLSIFAQSPSGSFIQMDYTGASTNGFLHRIGYEFEGIGKGYIRYRHYDNVADRLLQIGFGPIPLFTHTAGGGSFLFNGNNPILQLQVAGVDKGYLQLSGNDVRVGTNASNTDGRFVVRTAGNDVMHVTAAGKVGIGTSTPAYDLHVLGSMRSNINMFIDGNADATNVEVVTEVNKPSATGNDNLIPFAYGWVNGSTGVCTCSNPEVTTSRWGSGNYDITFSGSSLNTIILVSANQVSAMASSIHLSNTKHNVFTRYNSFGGTIVADADWSFIIYKQ